MFNLGCSRSSPEPNETLLLGGTHTGEDAGAFRGQDGFLSNACARVMHLRTHPR